MKYYYLIFCLLFSCSTTNNSKDNFGIVIHGGAGTISKNNMTEEMEKNYKNALKEAVLIGYEILNNGGSSQDAI